MRHYIFFLFLIIFSACSNTTHREFDTYKDVQQQGYLQNGWIPLIMPIDAYQIKEVHDLDLNYTFGMFRYSSIQIFSATFDTIQHYPLESIKSYIKEINRPPQPMWFIDIDKSAESSLESKKWNDFKFIVDKKNKTVYYVF
ncbi:MAG: hypothetical protein CRN43_03770 [Candidatus Nephrothrix sp. EaCA]|nr:MAG: hypothetical protein CRN43_03770 [Candidatus Nephrothrix sp. EaCA]